MVRRRWRLSRHTWFAVAVMLTYLGLSKSDALAAPSNYSTSEPAAAGSSFPVMGASTLSAAHPVGFPPGVKPLLAEDQVGGKVFSRDEINQRLDPAAIEYYTKAYGVSVSEARRRLTDQSLVVSVPQELADRTSVPLGDIWYDNARGVWRVQIVSEAGRAPVQDALQDLGLSGVTEIEISGLSLAELTAISNRVDHAVRETIDFESAGASVNRGRIRVYVLASVSDEMVGRVRRVVEETVVVENGPRAPYTVFRVDEMAGHPTVFCDTFVWGALPYNFWRRCNELLAGHDWLNRNVTPAELCSTGFHAGPPTVYVPYLYTAGHCLRGAFQSGQPWQACNLNDTCAAIGTMEGNYFGTTSYGDGMALHVTNIGFMGYPTSRWWNWSSTTYSQLTGYYPWDGTRADWGNVPEGTVVCKNGHWHTTCGTVDDNTYPPYWPGPPGVELRHMIHVVGMCTLPGDSGSPVTRADMTVAAGIAVGSNHNGVGTPTPTCNASPWTRVEPVGRYSAVLGLVPYG